MDYLTNLIKRSLQSLIVTTILVLGLWGILYHLTNIPTLVYYIFLGAMFCSLNTLIYNSRAHTKNLIWIKSSWLIMAGVVLVLYHAGFVTAAVFVAATIFASPFFWASIYEGIVCISLLLVLARLIFFGPYFS